MNGRHVIQMVLGALLCVVVLVLAAAVAASSAAAGGAQVTSGAFQTFAAGPERGYDISGRAQMVRTTSGQTLTMVQVSGLAPNTTYPVHVHNAACADGNGGGHYQDVAGGPVNSTNEIWPGITTNEAGQGNGKAASDFIARPEAQSVVIHDPDGARIACADLQ